MKTAAAAAPASSSSRPASPSKMDGSKFELAARESTILDTEAAVSPMTKGFQRAVDSFVLLVNGRPATLEKVRFENQDWKGVSVIGAVASLVGEDSLFTQCGWFQKVTWKWMHLSSIIEVKLKRNNQFRGGAPCVWLKTPQGEYAVFSPHKHFSKHWETCLPYLGDEAMPSRFRRILAHGPPPDWWNEQALDLWPTSNPPASPSVTKRQASTTTETLEALSLTDSSKKKRRSGPPDEGEHEPESEKDKAQVTQSPKLPSEPYRQTWKLGAPVVRKGFVKKPADK